MRCRATEGPAWACIAPCVMVLPFASAREVFGRVVDLLALLKQRCCLPSRAGLFDGSQRVYLSLPELSTKGEKRQR